jgi:hypothetical protein
VQHAEDGLLQVFDGDLEQLVPGIGLQDLQ